MGAARAGNVLARARTRAEKLYILAELAETIRTTIYRQTLFAEHPKNLINAIGNRSRYPSRTTA